MDDFDDTEEYIARRAQGGLKPADASLDGIVSQFIDASIDPAGSWISGGCHDDDNSMTIVPGSDSQYEVSLTTGGDCADWTMLRKATFADGILRLDRPVMHYCPIIYDVLLPLKTPGYTYLLPRATLPFLSERLNEQVTRDSHDFHQWIHWNAFHRKSEWERDRAQEVPHARWPLGYVVDHSWKI